MQEIPNEYLEKIQNLFKTYGIKSVTMDDVSRELGISKKTLYTYFTDKSELVEKILEKEFNDKAYEIHEAMSNHENAIEELFGYYKIQLKMISSQMPSFIYDLKKYYGSLFDKFKQSKHKAMKKGFIENLIRGKKEGLYRADLDEEIITQLHLARMDSLRASEEIPNEVMNDPKFLAEAFKYHAYAIVSDKGREIIKNNIDKIVGNA